MKNTDKAQTNKRLTTIFSFLKENMIDIISLIIAVVSLIASIYIGKQANKIAVRSQPLDYSVTASQQIKVMIMDGNIFTEEGIVFKQEKGVWSGDLTSVFLATVDNDAVDIVYVPDKMDEKDEFSHTAGNKMLYHIPSDNPNKLFFGPIYTKTDTINDKPQAFHFIFKGYNKEHTIYTVVFTLDEKLLSSFSKKDTGEVIANEGLLNIYVLNENNLYDHYILQQIADDLNIDKSDEEKLTSKSILEMLTQERNLCYESLGNAY